MTHLDETIAYLKTILPKCVDQEFLRVIAEQLAAGEGVTLAIDGTEERVVATVEPPSAQELNEYLHEQFAKVGHSTIPYDMLVTLRDQKVCNIEPWVWPKADHGAWDGPASEVEGLLNFILKYTRKRGLIVQAGGCCGMYPRVFAEYFSQVYTFEPDPLNFYCLTRNCQADNIAKFQAALNGLNGFLWVRRDGISNVGMHRVSTSPDDKRLLVQGLTIDSLNLPECDVIALDTEAYEPEILVGARETIDRFRPVIAVEMQRSDAITGFLTVRDYTAMDRNGADTIWIPKEDMKP